MSHKKIPGGHVYEGTPQEIIIDMSEKIVNILMESDIVPNGPNLIAMVNVVALSMRMHLASTPEEQKDLGLMPSFATLLSVLTHGIFGTSWSEEEKEAFNKDFVAIILSMGGNKVDKFGTAPFMAPIGNQVH